MVAPMSTTHAFEMPAPKVAARETYEAGVQFENDPFEHRSPAVRIFA